MTRAPLLVALAAVFATNAASQEPALDHAAVPDADVPAAVAADEASMQAYDEIVPGTDITFAMTPIPGGTFTLGSPETESDRGSDEGPQVDVTIAPFWMASTETTWDAYHVFMLRLDTEARAAERGEDAEQDAWADAVSRPTPPYVPMDFAMGVEGFPAISMTQFGARTFTKWLSMKTGRFYRLPTEAEWEYACRAGTTTRWSFGDDPAGLDDHAWHRGNSDGKYQLVGTKAPNPWGLHDMHGNVAEWVLDGHSKNAYAEWSESATAAINPISWPTKEFPRVVRGGSWDDDPKRLRSAARRRSLSSWKARDPQIPKSIWYLTNAPFLGFRVVRPLVEPSAEEKARAWDADLSFIRAIEQRQRGGGN